MGGGEKGAIRRGGECDNHDANGECPGGGTNENGFYYGDCTGYVDAYGGRGIGTRDRLFA